jgi:hypothetical protein
MLDIIKFNKERDDFYSSIELDKKNLADKEA